MSRPITRYNQKQIIKDLEKKMVFLSGPRQAGKTTLAKSLADKWPKIDYLNYDSRKDKSIFVNESWDREADVLVFDEVHKYKKWKNKIKGIFDTEGNRPRILVTGSARLAFFQKTGDSLAGRYFSHRLYPFSFKELLGTKIKEKGLLESLLVLGGFPEPFLSQSAEEAQRWRKQYIELVLTQDLRQLEDVKDLSAVDLLVDALRQRVGSPISFNSLARDLEISPNTVKRYVEILERLYLIFRVTPYHRNLARAILKEPKIYFYDNGMVDGDDGIKFENLIACHLIKHLHFLEDSKGTNVALHYVRDRQGHEVDFFYYENPARPAPSKTNTGTLLEVKLSGEEASKNLAYFQKQLGSRCVQVVMKAKRSLQHGTTRIVPAGDFLAGLAA